MAPPPLSKVPETSLLESTSLPQIVKESLVSTEAAAVGPSGTCVAVPSDSRKLETLSPLVRDFLEQFLLVANMFPWYRSIDSSLFPGIFLWCLCSLDTPFASVVFPLNMPWMVSCPTVNI